MPPEAGGVLTATSVPQAAVSELDDLSAAVQKDRLLSRQRKRARTAAREKQTHNFSLPGHRILRMEELFWKLMIHRQCCSIRRRDPGIRQSPPFGAETFLGRTISSWVGGAGNSGAPDR